jgi:hypothetical protein
MNEIVIFLLGMVAGALTLVAIVCLGLYEDDKEEFGPK